MAPTATPTVARAKVRSSRVPLRDIHLRLTCGGCSIWAADAAVTQIIVTLAVESIDPAFAKQVIIADAPNEGVIPYASIQEVSIGASVEQIVAVWAEQVIAAKTTDELIVAIAPVDFVEPRASLEQIVGG